MKILADLEQGSEQWFAVRSGRPTASEFSRIITATGKDSSQWEGYAIELCAECLPPHEVKFEGNYHTDRGNELEPEARDLFALQMGLGVQEVGFITRDDEIAGCSPDGLVYNEGSEEPLAGLEIKCPTKKNHAMDLIAGKLPDKHKQQVHGALAVTGLHYWYFVSYCRGLKPLIVRVERDAYTEKVGYALDRFLIYYEQKRKEVMPILKGE